MKNMYLKTNGKRLHTKIITSYNTYIIIHNIYKTRVSIEMPSIYHITIYTRGSNQTYTTTIYNTTIYIRGGDLYNIYLSYIYINSLIINNIFHAV